MSSLFIEKNSPFFRFARVINPGNIEKEKILGRNLGKQGKCQVNNVVCTDAQ
jgi:hypothetical protein